MIFQGGVALQQYNCIALYRQQAVIGFLYIIVYNYSTILCSNCLCTYTHPFLSYLSSPPYLPSPLYLPLYLSLYLSLSLPLSSIPSSPSLYPLSPPLPPCLPLSSPSLYPLSPPLPSLPPSIPPSILSLPASLSLPHLTSPFSLPYIQCARTPSLDRFFTEITDTPPNKVFLLGCGCSIATVPVGQISHFWEIIHVNT